MFGNTFIERFRLLFANSMLYRKNDPFTIERSIKSKLVEVRSVLDFGANPYDEDDATAKLNRVAIQNALDVLKSQRGGLLYFPEGVYVIDRPLIIEKDPDSLHPGTIGEYNNWLHLVGTGAMIKKAKIFEGDRLLTINAYSGDKEDSIIIEGLAFNGVNREVNGIDFFDQHVPYDAKHPTCPAEYGFPANPEATNYRKPSAGTKHVNIVNCIFVFCYIGARIWGNTQTFTRCQFRGNYCGAFIPTWGNDIRFVTCSFRVGVVGVDICSGVRLGISATECGQTLGAKNRQDDKGSASIGFQQCIFEDHLAAGIRSKGGNYISIHGGYFEQNGRDYEDGIRRYKNLTNQANYGLNYGAAIQKEIGSSGHGSVHIYGTYFVNQSILANSLKYCFIDCTGGLLVYPKNQCLLGPTFLHGAVDVCIETAEDARDGDTFVLNDVKRIVSSSAENGYVDASTR